MNHGSLFSGIGGFDLAAEWMGWNNKFHCEWNEFGQQILNYYWPEAESYGDITKTDFTVWNGKIDILTGGFPCQPYSQAGKRRGKEDERHLWPEMLRAIKEIEPRWIVGENVYGIVNWSDGMVFEEVQDELENEGYTVQPYILPAAGVNAPHQRYRVWFVAYAINKGLQRAERGESPNKKRESKRFVTELDKGVGTSTDTKSQRYESPENSRKGLDTQEGQEIHGRMCYARTEAWRDFPTQPPVCNGNDGVSTKLDGITFSKWRNESIKGGGNAIVPQVALQLFKTIQQYEELQ